MLDIVDLFRERDTRDELGLGSIRDAFADLFFPGTSTIMTRARYFLLVPWTYQRLEERRVPSTEFVARARKAELALVDVIASSSDSDGNIGKRARHALKRLPSSVYAHIPQLPQSRLRQLEPIVIQPQRTFFGHSVDGLEGLLASAGSSMPGNSVTLREGFGF